MNAHREKPKASPVRVWGVALWALGAGMEAVAATPPRAMLEKSAAYALDNTVRAFRVPTIGSTGAVKYYDVTIGLTVNNDGSISPVAEVGATLSPSVASGVIAPGTYKSTDGGTTCTVTNVALGNGRVQSALVCNNSAFPTYKPEVSVATGAIASGHPFLAQLVAAGIDKHSDAATYAWGLVTNGRFQVGASASCGGYYYVAGYPIGAKTNGSLLTLSLFNKTAPGAFLCTATFIKQ